MRSFIPARLGTATVAVVVAITCGVAGTAQAARSGNNGKPPKGGTTTTLPVSTSPTPSASTVMATISSAQTTVCPKVMEYTSCTAMGVTITDAGPTGWIGSAAPAKNTVTYNSYYAASPASTWANVVAHEAGGHVDAWNEIVAKVGTTQAWTDYYDLDYFGEVWAEGRYKLLKGTVRDFTRSEGKETYLDCAGPVAHGYIGHYLTMWGFSSLSAQQGFCASGVSAVMSDALSKSRPS